MSWILKVIIILLLFTVGAICIVNAVTYQKISTVKEDELPSDISKGGALALMWFNIIFATLTIIAGIWMFWARTIESAKKEKVLEAVSQSYNRGLVAAKRSFAPYARTPKTATSPPMPGYNPFDDTAPVSQRELLNQKRLLMLKMQDFDRQIAALEMNP